MSTLKLIAAVAGALLLPAASAHGSAAVCTIRVPVAFADDGRFDASYPGSGACDGVLAGQALRHESVPVRVRGRAAGAGRCAPRMTTGRIDFAPVRALPLLPPQGIRTRIDFRAVSPLATPQPGTTSLAGNGWTARGDFTIRGAVRYQPAAGAHCMSANPSYAPGTLTFVVAITPLRLGS